MKKITPGHRRCQTACFYHGLVLLFHSLSSMNCGGPAPPPNTSCNSTLTSFRQLYENILITGGYTENSSMDLSTHEYDFKVSQSVTICKVGYQGHPALQSAGIPYKIEILDGSGTILYSGNHVFGSSTTDYQAISPVAVNANQLYTIRRTISNTGIPLGQTTGRIAQPISGPMTFPQMLGNLTIVSSNFYGRGGPVPNAGVPEIDIVY